MAFYSALTRSEGITLRRTENEEALFGCNTCQKLIPPPSVRWKCDECSDLDECQVTRTPLLFSFSY
jgi:Zn finger protein HypA/HybF involved in hydrogenase expression